MSSSCLGITKGCHPMATEADRGPTPSTTKEGHAMLLLLRCPRESVSCSVNRLRGRIHFPRCFFFLCTYAPFWSPKTQAGFCSCQQLRWRMSVRAGDKLTTVIRGEASLQPSSVVARLEVCSAWGVLPCFHRLWEGAGNFLLTSFLLYPHDGTASHTDKAEYETWEAPA